MEASVQSCYLTQASSCYPPDGDIYTVDRLDGTSTVAVWTTGIAYYPGVLPCGFQTESTGSTSVFSGSTYAYGCPS